MKETLRPCTGLFIVYIGAMAFAVLRKLILQLRMRSHLVRLDVRFLIGPFVYFHTSCARQAKALAAVQARLSLRWLHM